MYVADVPKCVTGNDSQAAVLSYANGLDVLFTLTVARHERCVSDPVTVIFLRMVTKVRGRCNTSILADFLNRELIFFALSAWVSISSTF